MALPFPLAPYEEQKRIVDMVSELMALCDRLEAARAEREAARGRLLDAVLHEALAPTIEEAA
jgi:type I restriction enzyme S subunit